MLTGILLAYDGSVHSKINEESINFSQLDSILKNHLGIFDGKEARITIGKPEIPDLENYITIWTKSKPLVNILRKQFSEMWKESETL